jgi:hypothetical protein
MVHNDKLKVDEKFDDVADILPGKGPIEMSSLELVLVNEKVGVFF